MNLHALQSTVVRLMVDPALVEALHRGEQIAGLDDASLAMLRAVDPRAWGVDVHRRARLLTTILEESTATVAILGVDAADRFFASPAFARVVTDYGAMVPAFLRWAQREVGPIAELEGAIALARRRVPREGSGLVRAPGVEVIWVSKDTLDGYNKVQALLPGGVAALVRGVRAPKPRPGRGEEGWIITSTPEGEVSIGGASRPTIRLLLSCDAGRPLPDIVATARKLGAGADAQSVVADLVNDGLLVANP
jgi:hypothetical protein